MVDRRAAGLYTIVRPEVTGSIPGVSHKFRIVRIINSACLIKQPNGMYVQTYIRVKRVAVSVHSEAWTNVVWNVLPNETCPSTTVGSRDQSKIVSHNSINSINKKV